MSSNIIDTIPNSNLPSIINKSTTSLGGKTIRINNSQTNIVKEEPTKEVTRASSKMQPANQTKRPSSTRWR